MRRGGVAASAALLVALALVAGCAEQRAGVAAPSAEELNLTAEELLSRVESSDVDTFHADFVVETSGPGGSASSEVEVWYDGSERFRAERPGPNGEVMVSDGETVWRYTPGEGDVLRAEAGSAGLGYADLPSIAEARLRPEEPNIPEDVEMPDRVRTQIARAGEKRATVVRTEEYDGKECLVVRVEDVEPPNATSIRTSESEQLIWIDRERWFPLKIQTEHRGDGGSSVFTLAYRNVTYDPEVPPGTFEFEVPEGATVRNMSPPEPPSRPTPNSERPPPGTHSTGDLDEIEGEVPLPETPEGSTPVRVKVNRTEEGEILTVDVLYLGSDDIFFHLTTEDLSPSGDEVETVDVNGTEGLFFASRSPNGTRVAWGSRLLWRCGQFDAAIGSSDLSKREMVELAESMKCE